MKRSLICAALAINFAFACTTVRSEDVTSAVIEAAIKESGDFPSTRQFTAKLADKEVRIATYVDKESTQPIADCKIDAVLLARRVFQKFPTMVRVVVDFYPIVRRSTYRQVSITKAEILAFGTGQVNQEELLAGIRVEDVVDQQYVDQQRKAEELDKQRKDAANAAKKVNVDPKENAAASKTGWVEYNAGAIKFQRPASWKITSENDGQSLVEFDCSSSTKTESGVELKLYKHSKRPVVKEAESHVRGHMRYKGHQVTQRSKVVKFGVKAAFTGVTESFSYIADDGKRWYEEHIYFGWPGLVYKIRFEATRDDYNQLKALFNKLISTIELRK